MIRQTWANDDEHASEQAGHGPLLNSNSALPYKGQRTIASPAPSGTNTCFWHLGQFEWTAMAYTPAIKAKLLLRNRGCARERHAQRNSYQFTSKPMGNLQLNSIQLTIFCPQMGHERLGTERLAGHPLDQFGGRIVLAMTVDVLAQPIQKRLEIPAPKQAIYPPLLAGQLLACMIEELRSVQGFRAYKWGNIRSGRSALQWTSCKIPSRSVGGTIPR